MFSELAHWVHKMKQEFIPTAKSTNRPNTRPFIVAQAGSVLLNLSELQVLELQDEEKAKNLLSYLATMRLKMMEDLTAVVRRGLLWI